jgi:hypothetical protein
LTGGPSSSENNSEIATDKSIVTRREIESEERKDIERKAAEVDVDLAEKYGLVEDDEEDYGRTRGEKTRRDSENDVRGPQENEDDDESEEDAF